MTEASRAAVGDGLVNVREATHFLGCSVSTLYQLMQDGTLPSFRLGRSRKLPRKALVDFAAERLEASVGESNETQAGV